MSKTNRNFILLFIVVTITLLYFLYKYNKIIHHNQIDILVSNKIEIVQKELSNQKNQALSLAILFSKNEKIINNLEQNKPIDLKKELIKLLNNIKTVLLFIKNLNKNRTVFLYLINNFIKYIY